MNHLKSVLRSVLLLTGFILCALFFLLATTPGLSLLVKLVDFSLPGHLKIQHIEGCLFKGVSFSELRYSDTQLSVHMIRGDVLWKMTMNPWHPALIFNQIHIGELVLLAVPTSASSSNRAGLLVSRPLDIQLNDLLIDDLSVAKIQIHQVQLTAAINQETWSIEHFNARYDNQKIVLKAQGQLQKTDDLSAVLDLSLVSPLKNGLTGHINLNGDRTGLSWKGQFSGWAPVSVNGTLRHLTQLDATLSLGQNRLNIKGRLPDQLQMNAFIPQPQALHPALANIKTTINATGLMNSSRQADVVMTISPGAFEPSKNSTFPAVPFQGGTASFHLTPDGLLATSDFILNPNETIKASVSLPQFDWKRATSLSQAVDGTVNLRVNSLDFLNGASPFISNLHGQLSADLSLKGTLSQPDLNGTLKLSDAGVSFPEAGLILNPIQATLVSHNKHWDVTGSIVSGEGHLINITGSGEFLPQLMGSVMVNATDFPVLQTPEYTVNISPQLTLKIDQGVLDITGVIQVPSARFKPMVFSHTLNLTEDVVFVSYEPVNTTPLMHVKADVLIKVGQDVVVDAQGLHGVLGGEIQLIQPQNGLMSALGELTIRDGTYKAYGQNLAINHGQLLFSGATPSNPRVSLRAVRTFNNTSQFSGSNQLFDFNATNLQTIDFGNHVTVGIDVGGYLNDPKIKLFSIPSSLSQADILSMILLGKPASQASQSGGQLLLTAISAMNLDSGAKGMQLLSQVKQTLGLDLDVKSSSINTLGGNKTAGDTALVVGKALSKRLYLSYSIGILQENSNVLILKYLLNKYFSIQVTASNIENGVDLLYTHDLPKS